jgi:hypothetical protein
VAKILISLTFQSQIAGRINFLQGQYFIHKEQIRIAEYITIDNLENSSLGKMTVPTISYFKIRISPQYLGSGYSTTGMPDEIHEGTMEPVISKTEVVDARVLQKEANEIQV